MISDVQVGFLDPWRVMEATTQEERLIKTGKFKDVQREDAPPCATRDAGRTHSPARAPPAGNNIKFAVRLMLDNYRLADSIVDSSQLAVAAAQADAARTGREAVETLLTLLVRVSRRCPRRRA